MNNQKQGQRRFLHLRLVYAVQLLSSFLFILPTVVQAQFTFAMNDDSLTVTAYTGTNAMVVIPSITNGYAIVSIGEFAFIGNGDVTSVNIPESVTNIEDSAFADCAGLTNVSISGNVTSIENRVFFGCTSLTSVTIPNSVTSIGVAAFEGCGLTSIAIPNNVTNIEDDAFVGCTNLTSITLPNSVSNIGDNAFWYCTSLRSAYFQGDAPTNDGTAFMDDPVTVYYLPGTTNWNTTFGSAPTMEETAATEFDYNTNNDSIAITGYTGTNDAVVIPDVINGYPVVCIGQYSFSDLTSLTSVTIPPSVTSIGNSAFYDCFNLTNVTMGNNVTCIGFEAFFQCAKLTGMTLPNSVATIGYQAFKYCSQLTNVIFPESVTNIGSLAFAGCSSLTNETIPDGVISIGSGLFADCASLTNIAVSTSNPAYSSVNGVLFDKTETALLQYPDGLTNDCYTISNGVTTIGDFAFYNSGLTMAVIPNSVVTIGTAAFDDCLNLTNVVLPNSLATIREDAFFNCLDLTNIVIPASVTTLGDYAFASSPSLASAYFEGNAPPDDGTVFQGDPATVYYLLGTTGWGATFGGVSTMGETTPASQFTCVTNSDGVSITITGYTGSGGVVAIPNIINGYSVTSIGDGAFAGSNLDSVTIPGSVTNIGDSAFFDCSSLTSVYFLGNAPSLGSSVFGWFSLPFGRNPPGLVYPNCYYLPGTMGWDVNYGGCLTFMLAPPYICAVANGAITISGYTGIGGNLVISNSIAGLPVVGLSNALFFGSGLTNITIPSSVTNIGYWVFANCASLKSVYFLGNAPNTTTPPSYDWTEFEYDYGVTVFYLPGTTGWGTVFGDGPTAYGGGSQGGAQTALWLPSIQTADASFGVLTNQFGFNITWASDQTVVIETCTDPSNPLWTPISTNTLTCGTSYFSDPQWTNYSERYYRIRSQ